MSELTNVNNIKMSINVHEEVHNFKLPNFECLLYFPDRSGTYCTGTLGPAQGSGAPAQ